MAETIVRKKELAQHLGLTPGRVTQFVKAGLPVRSDGKVCLESALQWVSETRQRQASYGDRGVNRLADGRVAGYAPVVALDSPEAVPGAPQGPDIPPIVNPPSYAESRALRESALAALAQLKLATERGELIEADVVKREWISFVAESRTRLLTLPARIAARLPSLSQTDIAAIRDELNEALTELAGAE